MEFSGEFELEGVSAEEAWLVLSDPVAVRKALRGCKFLTKVEDEDFNFDDYEPEEDVPTLPEADHELVAERAFEEGDEYAALMKLGVGSVKPEFESRIRIVEREFPSMRATGSGSSSGSAFEMTSGMTISETETGAKVEWSAETDISGKIAQMGQRMLKPVANKVVNDFFENIEAQMQAVEGSDTGDGGLSSRVRDMLGD